MGVASTFGGGDERATSAAATEDDKSGSVRWDRFLPRASVRVLLVESDHSTREIVSALLSKCGYLVSSASDGLKAWEMLKANSQVVDLVLTEVDLPSLSGLDLLTLIMDHEVCRNIPVVMMSTSDSITMVFKCMRKGAADFLVKPIRKNELRILWQHVWRRYSSNGELGLQNRSADVPPAGQKTEASSDDNAGSNRFREPAACVAHKECDEKESDTQSSSTRPSRGAESSFVQNMQDLSQDTLWNSSMEKDTRGSEIIKESNQHKSDGTKTPSEVIDLLGVMRTIRQDVQIVQNGYAVEGNTSEDQENFVNGDKPVSHVTSAPHLELSLGGYESQNGAAPGTAGCNVLNHSNSSAFSRYSGRIVSPKSVNLGEKQEECFSKHNHIDQRPLANSSASDQEMKIQFNGEETTSTVTSCCNHECGPMQLQAPRESVNGVSIMCDQQSSFGTSMVPNVCSQQGDPPWRKQPITHKVIPIKYPGQSNLEVVSLGHRQQSSHDQTVKHLSYQVQAEKKHMESIQAEKKHMETDESVRHLPMIDKGGSTSMCSSNKPYLSNNNSQSACNGISVHLNPNNSANGSASSTPDNFQLTDAQCPTTNLQRSIRREAALTKFRLKRKDRCYEKKVRYHSRQKLAEQRPRVKGQFVRKAQPDNENGSG